jgi:rhamnose utilization protein RhaD (predicted bifunctional aldolase and dehydrogenase)
MKLTHAFVRLSKYAGMREDLVQAGGGNTSVKLDDRLMRVKASGVSLADVSVRDGFAEVDYALIRDVFTQSGDIDRMDEKALLAQCHINGGKPSIETFLHAMTAGVLTLHTHPMVVNMLACRQNGMDRLQELFPDAVMIPYARPGLPLAKSCFSALRNIADHQGRLIFLQNHGMVVGGRTVSEVIERTESALAAIESKLSLDMSAYRYSTVIYDVLSQFESDLGVVYYSQDATLEIMGAKGPFRYDFCPDCLVYCGKRPLILKDLDKSAIEEYYDSYGRPAVIWYQGHFYICGANMRKAKEIESVLRFAARVAGVAGSETRYLPADEQDFLLNWDAEKYRKTIK